MPILKRKKCHTAFTLVELLVVIGILAMLASLLMPVFASVREKARQTGCASNLKQIGLSVSLYAQDYDDKYPLAVNNSTFVSTLEELDPLSFIKIGLLPDFKTSLHPYTQSSALWICGSDTGFTKKLSALNPANENIILLPCQSASEKYGNSYLYRTNLGFQQIHYPTSAYTYAEPTQELGPSEVGVVTDMVSTWHGSEESSVSRNNVLFADGHVKSQNETQFIRCWFFPLQPPKIDGETSPDD